MTDRLAFDVPRKLYPLYEGITRPRENQHRFLITHGGRGSGKTWTISRSIVARCSMQSTFVMALRAVQNSITESSKKAIEDAIGALGLEDQWELGAYETAHKGTGSRIVYRGMNGRHAQALKSTEGVDIAWLDEGEAVERRPWDLLVPTIRKDRSIVVVSYNPYDPEHCIHHRFVNSGNPPPDALVIECNFPDNPWFPKALDVQQQSERLEDEEYWLHKWMGKPLLLSALQVFHAGKHWVKGDLDGEIPHGAIPCYGMDIGMGSHPSVVLQAWRFNGIIYIAKENVTKELTHGVLEDFVGAVGVKAGDTVWSDHQTLPWHRAPDGWSLRHVPKRAGGEDAGVKWIKKHKVVVNPSCELTIRHFTRYAYKTDANGEILEQYDEHDDDAIDCVRYAFHKPIHGLGGNKTFIANLPPC